MSRILRKFSSQTRRDLPVPHHRAPEQFRASVRQPGDPPEITKFHENEPRAISRIKTVLGAVVAALAVMTALWPNWIERVFLIDPDHHSGSVEWNIVMGCALAASLIAVLGRRNWRKSPAAI